MQEYNIKSTFLLDIEDQNIDIKNLVKKQKEDCTLFKYDRNIDIDNIEEISECRGIIINNNSFICLPPSKNIDSQICKMDCKSQKAF